MADSIRNLIEWCGVLVITGGLFYLFLYLRDRLYRPPDVLEPDVDDELMTRIPPRWGK